jgi:mRNA interferase YafQ
MMPDVLTPIYTNPFRKDLERMKRRGKDIEKLKALIILLSKQQQLPAKYQDHKLQGKYIYQRECHIEPDWLLVYKRDETTLTLERTGSHADLFE